MAVLEQLEVHGWEVLRLTSDTLQVDVVPALGGTIISLRRRHDDAELLWRTPWGLRRRSSLVLPGNATAQMYDQTPGGWFSLFPNAGDSIVAHGAEWGMHGEARVTWLDWEFTGSSLLLTGRLVRAPFTIAKIISLRDRELTVGETVTNVGGERIEAMWGSQLMLGGDLVGPDTGVNTSASIVHPDPAVAQGADYHDMMPWPRSLATDAVVNLRNVPGPGTGQTRLAYLTDFDGAGSGAAEGRLIVERPSRGLRLELSWDLDAWPHAWYELEAGGSDGFPWFAGAYFLALTPCTSWPSHGLHDARRVSDTTVWLEPGAARTSQLSARVLG